LWVISVHWVISDTSTQVIEERLTEYLVVERVAVFYMSLRYGSEPLLGILRIDALCAASNFV
jgi:hypothetical protein